MQARRFGHTGHLSTVAIFGAAAFWQVTQAQADATMQLVIDHGINHIDVAPSYGLAEERLGPWLARERNRFFVGCKTMERSQAGAAAELRRSLQRLRLDHVDLYQIHAITSMVELDAATRTGGALDAIRAAQEAGLTKYIGITGHGADSPAIFLEALRRFDFDSVLFPLNFVQVADPRYRENTDELLRQCQARDVGVMIIKAITKGPWGGRPQTHTTWYEPFDRMEDIQRAVNFALSFPVTGLCTAGDTTVLPLMLKACQNFTPQSAAEREALIHMAGQYEPLFAVEPASQ
ncbi:MAG: aldo/keto reductase [Anaerolineae bacterium]